MKFLMLKLSDNTAAFSLIDNDAAKRREAGNIVITSLIRLLHTSSRVDAIYFCGINENC